MISKLALITMQTHSDEYVMNVARLRRRQQHRQTPQPSDRVAADLGPQRRLQPRRDVDRRVRSVAEDDDTWRVGLGGRQRIGVDRAEQPAERRERVALFGDHVLMALARRHAPRAPRHPRIVRRRCGLG